MPFQDIKNNVKTALQILLSVPYLNEIPSKAIKNP